MTEQRSTLVIEIDSRNAERNARNIARELQSIERTGDFATRSMDSMSVATRNLVGYMGGLVTIGAAINRMDAYTNLYNKLKVVTDTQQQLNSAMTDTYMIAQKVGATWESVNDVYSKYVSNSKALNLSQDQLARLTEITTKAVAMSGSTAQAAAGALFQYGQSIDGNILRAQEYNSLVDGAAGLLNAMAKGLNVTRAELRQMMLDGELTGEVITQALLKAGDSVDKLYDKTATSIGQGFAQVSNAIIKYVGELDQAIDGSKNITIALKSLAENLDTVTNVAMIGGAYWLGTYIPTILTSISVGYAKSKQLAEQTAIQWSAINAEKTAALSSLAQAQAQLRNTEMTLAALAAEKNLEAQRLKAQITGAGRIATTTRMAQLRQIEVQVTAELTIAQNALTAAQQRLNAAQNMSLGVGRGLLGILSGPVGLGLTVAAVAGSYLMLKDSTKDTTSALDIQKGSVDDLVQKYSELDDLQKRTTMRELEKQILTLSTAYTVAYSDLNAYVGWLEDSGSISEKTAKKVNELFKQYNKGKIDASEFSTSVGKLTGIQESHKVKIDELTTSHQKTKVEYDRVKTAQAALTNQTPGAVKANDAETGAIERKRKALEGVKTAYDEYQKTAIADIKEMAARVKMQSMNLSTNQIDERIKVLKALDYKPELAHSQIGIEMKKLADVTGAMKDKEDAITAAKKDQTKELEKQTKLGQRLIGISGNSGIGTGAHLDVRYGGSRDGQKVSKEHLSRLQAGGKSLSSYRVSSDYGQRKAPTKGASSFHKGIDFAMPVNTPITTSVAVKDVKTAYDSKGGGYYSTVTFEDGVVLKLLHQAPSAMSKIKGGSSDGTLKSNQDLEKQAEDQARNQIQLQMTVASEKVRIETQLKNDIENIRKAGFSPEETKRLISEYQAHADNDIAISQYALKTKLDDYSAFKKTESELLEDSFNEKKFYASRDIELSKDQRNKAIALLDEQLKHEQALLMLANETRLFQLRESLMTETAAMMERYRLEREQILQNSKLSEEQKQREIALSKATQQEESRRRLNTATQQWGGIQADINGTGDQYRLEQERFSRYDASQDVFDSQMALAETAAERESIWQAHHDRMSAIEADYQTSSYSLQLGYGQQVTGALSGMFGAMLGESSSAYRALYGAQQSFALAQAGMNVWKSASDAYANEPGTWYQKAAAAAIATLESGTFVSMIQAATPKGFETGGYTGSVGRKEVAGVVHGQEYVLNAAATKRVGVGALDAINSGKGLGGGDVVNAPITVNVSIQANGDSSVDSQGQSKQLGLMIGNAVRTVIRQEQRQGGLLSK